MRNFTFSVNRNTVGNSSCLDILLIYRSPQEKNMRNIACGVSYLYLLCAAWLCCEVCRARVMRQLVVRPIEEPGHKRAIVHKLHTCSRCHAERILWVSVSISHGYWFANSTEIAEDLSYAENSRIFLLS